MKKISLITAALLLTTALSAEEKSFLSKVSLIGDFSLVDNSKDTKHLSVPGFTHAHGSDSGHSHASLNEKDGLNLNYAELSLSSSVDNYVDLTAIFHLSEDDFEIEELYATTKGLPANLNLKVGKFLSDFGRLNVQHHHYWNFADQPLIYNVFLGEHGLNEKGLALNWIAPTPFYLNFGAEVFNGENESSFGRDAITHPDDEEDVVFKESDQGSLKVGYIKTSTDIGNLTLLGGVSIAKGDARINHLSDDEEPHAFGGDTTLKGADLTLKYKLGSYSDITLTSEYLQREMDGKKLTKSGSTWITPTLKKEQAGYYSELVYKHNNTWRYGIRVDKVTKNDVIANSVNQNKPDDLKKHTAMIEYNFNEFNRLRLQYSEDKSLYNEDDKAVTNSKVILQWNLVIGSHGAHSF
jgi:hypothetical protein